MYICCAFTWPKIHICICKYTPGLSRCIFTRGCISAHVQINFYIYVHVIAFICPKIHRGANYTYMYNIHPVCKSAHVNGAYDEAKCWVIVVFCSFSFNQLMACWETKEYICSFPINICFLLHNDKFNHSFVYNSSDSKMGCHSGERATSRRNLFWFIITQKYV